MTYRVYIRSHADGETGRVRDKTNTYNPHVAEAAYRALLAREDLDGQPCAAVLSRDNRTIYFSAFDDERGKRRIHPGAPLDLFRQDDGTREAAAWRPSTAAPPAHDWEADPRPLADCLKAWHGRPGWTREIAAEKIPVPFSTYNGWCAGRAAENEALIRRSMTRIDREEAQQC